MNVKVCGLKDPGNILRLAKLRPDFMGFIFAKESKRCLTEHFLLEDVIRGLEQPKVGVFVDESIELLQDYVRRYKLDYVQLHGSESPEFSEEARHFCKLIKVFKVDTDFDFSFCDDYDFADLFLFDAKGEKAGGNGVKFGWNRIQEYNGSVPFLLSGGIHLSDVFEIQSLEHDRLYGVDINSGFEVQPGIKNEVVIDQFINELKPTYAS